MQLPYQLEPVIRSSGAGPESSSGIGPSSTLKFRCKEGLLHIKCGKDSSLTTFPCEGTTKWAGAGAKSTKRIGI